MSQRRKLIILVLLVLTVILAVLGILISNNIRVIDSSADITTDFTNCNTTTGTCTVPSDDICNEVKVYVHRCTDIKANGVDCVNPKTDNYKDDFVSGDVINISDYIVNKCGTVQMYLESATSSATSVGACGSLKTTFPTVCIGDEPAEEPVSTPVEEPSEAPTEEPTEEEPTEQPTEEEPVEEEPIEEEPVEGEEAEINNSVSVITQSASTCSANGDATVNYTIVFTNIGNQAAEINSIIETLDSKITTNLITPVNFIPSATTATSSQITWTGPISIQADETKSYKYSIVIPENKLSLFTSGITTQSIISYDNAVDTGNTASFTLNTTINCTVPTTGLPNTGILDDLRFFLIGILFITLGYYVYKRDIGLSYSMNFLGNVAAFRRGTKKKISKSLLNAAPFEEGIELRISKKIDKVKK